MSGVTLRDMENEVRVMNGIDISLSNDIGNVIQLDDMNDTFGLSMLTNNRTSSMPIPQINKSSNDNNLYENLEPINIQLNDTNLPPFEAEIKRESTNIYNNNQTSSAQPFVLEQPQTRIVNENEKKEKMEYINKLQRLESKGFPVSRRYTMDNTLDEVRDEYNRLLDARNLEASLRFQRQALMGIVTGLEWANGKFDPFDLKLDGWSESVHENVEDFDDIFEELYDKYKEKGKMPPEARLMMTLAGSGFMCHVSNTFLRSRMPNVDDVLRNNPEIARQVASAAASSAGPGFGNFMNMAMNGGKGPQTQQQQQQQQQSPNMFNMPSNMPNAPASSASTESPSSPVRREMKGPTGVDDILKVFEEARKTDVYMMPENISSVNQPATAAAVELQSLHSEEILSQAESTKTGRGGGRRRRAPVGSMVSISV